jgi:inositol-pentakisphosphate 2-kinase
MNPLDWKYAGEGGEHALFAYHPMSGGGKTSEYDGMLLRIRKKDLAMAAGFSRPEKCLVRANLGGNPTHYFRNIISTCIGPYIDIPEIVELEWSFLQRLQHIALSDGQVPLSRQQDWNLASNGTAHDSTIPMGMLVADYRRLGLPKTVEGGSSSERCISVEIKPKAGYTAVSPLVHPLHRIKFLETRFQLLQKLHRNGRVSKAWTSSSDSFDMSTYDPRDLFSGDMRKIRRAINSLLCCPQNNLRIWHGESMLIGLGSDQKSSNSLCSETLREMFNFETVAGGCRKLGAVVGEIVVSILSHENLLTELLKLQEFDILDADGAILVYNRLVALNNGSEKEVESNLDSPPTRPTSLSEKPHAIFRASPFVPPPRSSNFARLCDEIDRFRQLLVYSLPSLPSVEELDKYRECALRFVDMLSAEECEYLLRNWLLSLAMCDVSLFITIQLASPLSSEPRDIRSEDSKEQPLVAISKGVSSEPGLLTWKVPDGESLRFAYNVKLIDCDGKPAKKLRTRSEKEIAFRSLQPPSARC